MHFAIASTFSAASPSTRRRLAARTMLGVALLAALHTLPLALAAQPSGTLTGTARDAEGAAIAGVMIAVAGTRASATSDADGAFRMQRVPAGRIIIQSRRLGFRPSETSVMLEAGQTLEVAVTLHRVVPKLAAVHVEGSQSGMSARLAGFYSRRDKGLGRFITREDIDRRAPFRTTDLLRSIPGVRVRTVDGFRSVLYFRSASCTPLVFLDGAPAAAGYFDPDLVAPGSIEGIEVYSGPSTVPPQFIHSRKQGSCGVIVIWSRSELPPPRRRGPGENARALEDLVEDSRIFTVDQVDTVAMLTDTLTARPAYPERLYFERTGGQVVAEFVVDTLGRVEKETMGVVSSTHREFADAVMSALTRALFRPAIRNGHRVRQLVQQPFTFEPGQLPPPADMP